MGQRWYVVQFQSTFGAASLAERHLQRQGFLVEVPRHPRTGREIFSGYGFVLLDLVADAWQAICSTRGVLGLLPRFQPVPLAVPTAFVEELRAAIADYAEPEEVVSRWRRDSVVPIVSGPLATWTGRLDRYHKGALVLLVSLLGVERRVEIPLHQCGRPPAAPRSGRAPDPRLEAVAVAS